MYKLLLLLITIFVWSSLLRIPTPVTAKDSPAILFSNSVGTFTLVNAWELLCLVRRKGESNSLLNPPQIKIRSLPRGKQPKSHAATYNFVLRTIHCSKLPTRPSISILFKRKCPEAWSTIYPPKQYSHLDARTHRLTPAFYSFKSGSLDHRLR